MSEIILGFAIDQYKPRERNVISGIIEHAEGATDDVKILVQLKDDEDEVKLDLFNSASLKLAGEGGMTPFSLEVTETLNRIENCGATKVVAGVFLDGESLEDDQYKEDIEYLPVYGFPPSPEPEVVLTSERAESMDPLGEEQPELTGVNLPLPDTEEYFSDEASPKYGQGGFVEQPENFKNLSIEQKRDIIENEVLVNPFMGSYSLLEDYFGDFEANYGTRAMEILKAEKGEKLEQLLAESRLSEYDDLTPEMVRDQGHERWVFQPKDIREADPLEREAIVNMVGEGLSGDTNFESSEDLLFDFEQKYGTRMKEIFMNNYYLVIESKYGAVNEHPTSDENRFDYDKAVAALAAKDEPYPIFDGEEAVPDSDGSDGVVTSQDGDGVVSAEEETSGVPTSGRDAEESETVVPVIKDEVRQPEGDETYYLDTASYVYGATDDFIPQDPETATKSPREKQDIIDAFASGASFGEAGSFRTIEDAYAFFEMSHGTRFREILRDQHDAYFKSIAPPEALPPEEAPISFEDLGIIIQDPPAGDQTDTLPPADETEAVGIEDQGTPEEESIGDKAEEPTSTQEDEVPPSDGQDTEETTEQPVTSSDPIVVPEVPPSDEEAEVAEEQPETTLPSDESRAEKTDERIEPPAEPASDTIGRTEDEVVVPPSEESSDSETTIESPVVPPSDTEEEISPEDEREVQEEPVISSTDTQPTTDDAQDRGGRGAEETNHEEENTVGATTITGTESESTVVPSTEDQTVPTADTSVPTGETAVSSPDSAAPTTSASEPTSAQPPVDTGSQVEAETSSDARADETDSPRLDSESGTQESEPSSSSGNHEETSTSGQEDVPSGTEGVSSDSSSDRAGSGSEPSLNPAVDASSTDEPETTQKGLFVDYYVEQPENIKIKTSDEKWTMINDEAWRLVEGVHGFDTVESALATFEQTNGTLLATQLQARYTELAAEKKRQEDVLNGNIETAETLQPNNNTYVEPTSGSDTVVEETETTVTEPSTTSETGTGTTTTENIVDVSPVSDEKKNESLFEPSTKGDSPFITSQKATLNEYVANMLPGVQQSTESLNMNQFKLYKTMMRIIAVKDVDDFENGIRALLTIFRENRVRIFSDVRRYRGLLNMPASYMTQDEVALQQTLIDLFCRLVDDSRRATMATRYNFRQLENFLHDPFVCGRLISFVKRVIGA